MRRYDDWIRFGWATVLAVFFFTVGIALPAPWIWLGPWIARPPWIAAAVILVIVGLRPTYRRRQAVAILVAAAAGLRVVSLVLGGTDARPVGSIILGCALYSLVSLLTAHAMATPPLRGRLATSSRGRP
jgi:hypothetical protein